MKHIILSVFIVLGSISCRGQNRVFKKQNKKAAKVESNDVKPDQNGLVGDGVFYWGTLKVEPLGNGTSRVSSSDENQPFLNAMVGKHFVSSRIHKNPNKYPKEGDNYWPGLITCRYSKVVKVESPSALIVDFEYNGGDENNPKTSENVDGYFFTNNRGKLKRLIESADRDEEIVLEDDKIYVIKGLPNATPKKPLIIKRSGTGKNKPILMLSIEDAFNMGVNGNGSSKTFWRNFGGKNFIVLPTNDNHCIIKDIDISPPIYTQKVVGYGYGYDYFFLDKNNKSSQNRIAKIENCNIDVIKEKAQSVLGKERKGMTWDMPIFAKCMNGGTDDGTDITGLSEYGLYNTSWRARTVMNLKGKSRAGLLFKVVGSDPNNPLKLRENLKVKTTSFQDVPIKFELKDGNTIVSIKSNSFNWYLMANQYWCGGNHSSPKTYNKAEVELNGKKHVLYFHNNGNFRKQFGRPILKGVFINAKKARIFDSFVQKNDEIKWVGKEMSAPGVIKKNDDNTVEVWGYQMAEGDKVTVNGKTYTIAKIKYLFKKENDLISIHYWRWTLDGPPIKSREPKLKVLSSLYSQLLDGNFRKSKVFVNRGYFGHLFYTDGGVNMHMENVNTYGYWRSSSHGVGKPKKLYKAGQIAYFKNVSTFRKGGVGRNWTPPYLNYRLKTQKGDYYVKIDGGNIDVVESSKSDFTVKVFNKPFIKGNLKSPVNGDDRGLGLGKSDKPLKITLRNGDSFSVKDLKGQAIQLAAFGKCTLVVDGYEGEIVTHKGKERMEGINISTANANTRLYIVGSGGKAPISVSSQKVTSTNQVKINLRNWRVARQRYSNRFILYNFSPAKDPDYYLNVKARGLNNQDLIKPNK